MEQSILKVMDLRVSSSKSFTKDSVKTVSSNKTSDNDNKEFYNVLSKNTSAGKQTETDETTSQAGTTGITGLENSVTKAKAVLSTDGEENQTDGSTDVMADFVAVSSEAVSSTEEDVESAAEDIFSSLKQQIADILGIDQKDLEKIMAESGMTAMDLLNPEQLKSLLLDVKNIQDSSELLTNESLLNDYQQLVSASENAENALETLQDFSKDFISDEKFQNLLQNAAGEQVSSDTGETAEASQENQESVDGQLQQPVITVEKEDVSENSNMEQDDSKDSNNGQELDNNAIVNQFSNKLADSISNTDSVDGLDYSKAEMMKEIVNQVVEQIKVKISSDSSSVEMQLNPEELGKVNVSVVSKDGQLTATFTVQNHLAKEALENQLVTLRDNLANQGLKVDAIEVTVSQNGFEQNNFSDQQNNFGNSSKKKSSSDKKIFSSDENDEVQQEEMVETVLSQGGMVDYSA